MAEEDYQSNYTNLTAIESSQFVECRIQPRKSVFAHAISLKSVKIELIAAHVPKCPRIRRPKRETHLERKT